VFFVTKKDHRYLTNEELREEGGTPAIVESIRYLLYPSGSNRLIKKGFKYCFIKKYLRAGLVFQLKQAINPENIMIREKLIKE
jgi:hypothetical protein